MADVARLHSGWAVVPVEHDLVLKTLTVKGILPADRSLVAVLRRVERDRVRGQAATDGFRSSGVEDGGLGATVLVHRGDASLNVFVVHQVEGR